MPGYVLLAIRGSKLFGIGSTELLVILVVALVVLGPKSLAGISRSLGRAVGEFRRVSTDFQRTLNVEAAEEEARQQAARRRETTAKVAEAQEAAGSQFRASEKTVAEAITLEKVETGPPADSPLGQAIAKARAQAASQHDAANPASGGAA